MLGCAESHASRPFGFFTLIAAASFARAAEQVDLLLVLAADVSRSVDQPKFQLQREGYAAALSRSARARGDPSGPNRRIAICFVEWSGAGAQKLVIDWTLIDGAEAARSFGDQLVEAPRSFADRTSICGGIDFSMAQLERAPFIRKRRTIDVSGDGTNNAGRDVARRARRGAGPGRHHQRPCDPERAAAAVESGAHQSARRACEIFQDNVIGGPGAFVIVAEDFKSFGQALISKLIAEIAAAPDDATTSLAAAR